MSLPLLTGLMTPTEAVNICLVAANLSPINSSVNIDENVAAYAAWLLILEESRQVQSSGWHFNTNFNVTLPVDTNGEISLPSNYLKIYVRGGRYAARGQRLYNRVNNTFQHQFSVTAKRLVVLLEWDELMQQARYYIAVRAARRYLASRAGAEVSKQYSGIVEASAKIDLEQADAELAEADSTFHSEQVYTWKRRGR